jgi:hypothetical protein
VDLTPGERAILGQLRDLYAGTSKREHSLGTITGQWPPIHHEAYKDVLKNLVAKRLLVKVGNGHALRITDEGLRTMGVGAPLDDSTRTIDLKPFPKREPAATGARAPSARTQPARPRSGGRLAWLVLAAAIVIVAWLLLTR